MSLNNSMMGLGSTAANALQQFANETENSYINEKDELVNIKIGCSGNGSEADYEIGDTFGNGELYNYNDISECYGNGESNFDIREFGGNGITGISGNGSNPFGIELDDVYEEVQNNFFMDVD